MHQISLNRKEEILMRSAQSRLGVVTSLGSARRGVGRCVAALPVPTSALKIGGAAVAGIAGAVMARGLFRSRKKAVPAPAASSGRGMGLLFSEATLTLLLPLLRRYFLSEKTPGASSSGRLADRLTGGGN